MYKKKKTNNIFCHWNHKHHKYFSSNWVLGEKSIFLPQTHIILIFFKFAIKELPQSSTNGSKRKLFIWIIKKIMQTQWKLSFEKYFSLIIYHGISQKKFFAKKMSCWLLAACKIRKQIFHFGSTGQFLRQNLIIICSSHINGA